MPAGSRGLLDLFSALNMRNGTSDPLQEGSANMGISQIRGRSRLQLLTLGFLDRLDVYPAAEAPVDKVAVEAELSQTESAALVDEAPPGMTSSSRCSSAASA